MKEDEIITMNLWEKLLHIEGEIKGMAKDATSGTGKFSYEYVTGNKVLHSIRPLLQKYRVHLKIEALHDKITTTEITYQVKDWDTKQDKDKTGFLYKVPMLMTWRNIDNPDQTETVEWCGFGENGIDKGYGSALTYGERYFYLKEFKIPTDEDDPDHKDQPVKSAPKATRGVVDPQSIPAHKQKPVKKSPTPVQWNEMVIKWNNGEVTMDQIERYFILTPEQKAQLT